MHRFILYFIFLLFLSSCQNVVDYEPSDPKYQVGDSLKWKQPELVDTEWQADPGTTGNRIFWARVPVDIQGDAVALGVRIGAFGAFDVYWDGVLLGHNGSLAIAGKAEVPGTESSVFSIPDQLVKRGKHIVALRSTQTYAAVQRGIDIKIDSYVNLISLPLIMISLMNLMAGAFFIAGLYYLFMYINSSRKDRSILVFGIVCLLFFTLLVLECIKFYVRIPYTHFYLRLEGIGWLTFAISLLIPFYFTIQFRFKQNVLFMAVLVGVLLCIYFYQFSHYDITAMYFSYTMWAASVFIVVNALLRKEDGAWIVLTGLVGSAVVNYFLVFDFGLFISFTVIVICMLYLHTIKVKKAEKAHDEAIKLSSMLKLELIKKNIQPHFIKNTLTSLIDWLEESPAEGAIFLQALAREFDLFNEIADQSLIPLHTEIALCKTHLKLMEFRKEIKYTWEESEGIEGEDLIPPAIFHTMLENGITHSQPDLNNTVRFKMGFELVEGTRIYTLETIATNRSKIQKSSSGTGFKYIEARLTESYGDDWKFTAIATPTGWMNTISIAKI